MRETRGNPRGHGTAPHSTSRAGSSHCPPGMRAERPEARELVAALRGRQRGEAAEREHEVERLALAGLPRILAEPDTNPVASCVAVLSSNRSTSPGLARARTTSNSQ